MVDGVHALYPFHLILCFQFFRYALLCLHLAGQMLQPLLTSSVDSLQVFHKPAGEKKPRVQPWAMFFEVAQAHPPIFAQRALLCFGQVKVGPQAASFSAAGELHGEILAFRCITKAAMA